MVGKKRGIIDRVLLMGLAFFMGSCSSPKEKEGSSCLFVIQSKVGHIEVVDREYRLELSGVRPQVVWFRGCDQCESGLVSLEAFIDKWDKRLKERGEGASKGRVLAFIEEDGTSVERLIEVNLARPEYRGKGLQLVVIPMKSGGEVKLGESDHLTLFIDEDCFLGEAI